MDSPTPPPPYAANGENFQWKIRNAKYRKFFITGGEPTSAERRTHLDMMASVFRNYNAGISSAHGESEIYDVQYSQAFSNIERLIYEYRECLTQIKPLREEDVLFLLLDRFSKSSGSKVYVEISTPRDIQLYDSEIPEPLCTSELCEHLGHTSGVINAEFCLPSRAQSRQQRSSDEKDAPTPRRTQETRTLAINTTWDTMNDIPSLDKEHSITLNFPRMLFRDRLDDDRLEVPNDTLCLAGESALTGSSQSFPHLPKKLQPPLFTVHRCNNRDVKESGNNELPLGFPEVVQHFDGVPDSFYNTGFFLPNRIDGSTQLEEGYVYAFSCQLLPSGRLIYVTAQREGQLILYNCFRDGELWAMFHNHQNCNKP